MTKKTATNTIDKPAINNWQKKDADNKNVMPKSGWKIIKPTKTKKEKNNIFKYIFLPSMPLHKNQALKIKKKGLINSEGWILILIILIHRLDPLIS